MIKALKKLCDILMEIFRGYNNPKFCFELELAYEFSGGIDECKEFKTNNRSLSFKKPSQRWGNSWERFHKRACIYYKEINRTEYYKLLEERKILAPKRREEKIIEEQRRYLEIQEAFKRDEEKREKEQIIREEEALRRYQEAEREKQRRTVEEKEKCERRQAERERQRRTVEEKEKCERRQEEREKQRRIQEEKQKHLNSIEEAFQQNYLISKKLWLEKSSHLIEEKKFYEMAADFVVRWFREKRWPLPDQEQALCISEVWENVQVVARAGSGKTTTAVNRSIFLIEHCKIPPNKILLLAFNKKAAQEITDRLREKLGDKSPQAMTFHALAYAVVHPEDTLIYDSEDNGFKKSATVQQVIDSYIHSPEWSKIIRDVMIKYFRSSWEEIENMGYNLSSSKMVEYRRGLSYLGLDGKYYKSKAEKKIADFLFEREVPYLYEKNIFWDERNYKPDFTIPVKGKCRGIIIEYFGLIGDIEYDREVEAKRNFWHKMKEYKFIEILPRNRLLSEDDIAEAIEGTISKELDHELIKLGEEELWHKIKDRAVDEFSKTVSQFLSLCRLKKISPDDLCYTLDEIRRNAKTDSLINRKILEIQFDFIQIVKSIYQDYLSTIIMNNEEDFQGLLLKATEKITNGKGGWIRKEGEGNLANIRYLFIDEYQDFSKLFYEMVVAISKINAELKLFCVGDDWQAINGFAGSDLKYFVEFSSFFPEARKLVISRNYRSAIKIVDVGNKLMEGKGKPAKAFKEELGEANLAWLDAFIPSTIEKQRYKGDLITPALIRLVYSYILRGQRVALLCRRRNGISWYTPYSNTKGLFLENLLNAIKAALTSDQRSMVVDMNTAHSYKGKEEDAIIVVDAVNRSYPLIHPNNIFFDPVGQTVEELILEEERLFYVALTRARKSVTVISERLEMSPFLRNITGNFELVRINELPLPSGECTEYIVYVSNNLNPVGGGTYEIREYLQAHKYRWNSNKESWVKCCSAKSFDIKTLLKESWVNKARNVYIFVKDEFDETKYIIEIDSKGGIQNQYLDKK